MQDNQFYSLLPLEWGEEGRWGELRQMNLSNNHLQGSIPGALLTSCPHNKTITTIAATPMNLSNTNCRAESQVHLPHTEGLRNHLHAYLSFLLLRRGICCKWLQLPKAAADPKTLKDIQRNPSPHYMGVAHSSIQQLSCCAEEYSTDSPRLWELLQAILLPGNMLCSQECYRMCQRR